MKKQTILGLAGALALGVTAWSAQDTKEASAPSPETMAAMMPGPMHAKLQPLVGSWEMKGKWRMTPEAPWEEFEAAIEREWVMDGRFVKEGMDSEWMGQPFLGEGYIGYDNVREEYVMMWMDNFSTGIASFTGQISDDGKRMTFEGTNSNPMTGDQEFWGKSVLNLESANRNVYLGYSRDADGNEFQNAEMIAERK